MLESQGAHPVLVARQLNSRLELAPGGAHVQVHSRISSACGQQHPASRTVQALALRMVGKGPHSLVEARMLHTHVWQRFLLTTHKAQTAHDRGKLAKAVAALHEISVGLLTQLFFAHRFKDFRMLSALKYEWRKAIQLACSVLSALPPGTINLTHLLGACSSLHFCNLLVQRPKTRA